MMDDGDVDEEMTLALMAAPAMDDADEDEEITMALQAASHRASQAAQVQTRRAASDPRRPRGRGAKWRRMEVRHCKAPSGIAVCSLHPLRSRLCAGVCVCNRIRIRPEGRTDRVPVDI